MYCTCYRSLATLDHMWIKETADSGFFCRHPNTRYVKFAFTNFGVSYGLQGVGMWPDRVNKLNNFFTTYKSHDEYDTKSITHVMHVNSLMPGVLLKT